MPTLGRVASILRLVVRCRGLHVGDQQNDVAEDKMHYEKEDCLRCKLCQQARRRPLQFCETQNVKKPVITNMDPI
jgi:hypothetical protein